MHDALISIKPIYVDRFIKGKKGVEIRSRHVNLLPNSRLWIYSTLPKACIQALAHIDRVEVGAPTSIWKKYSNSIGVSKKRFYRYVNGSRKISAIIVKQTWKLPCDISLQSLRDKVPGFHPPQFLKYMNETDPLLSAIVDFLFESSGIDAPEALHHISGGPPTR